MTRQDLSSVLGAPLEASATELLNARSARVDEINRTLRQDDLPKPVKIMLARELADLGAKDVLDLVSVLEQAARAEALLADIDGEMAKAGWTRGVVELLCRKVEPVVAGIPEGEARLEFEKHLAVVSEKLRASTPPVPVAAVASMPAGSAAPIPTAGTSPPQDVEARLESYFAEIAAERSKPSPSRGVVRLWLQKINALLDQLTVESTHLAFEKRMVETEYWLEGSQPPWAAGRAAPRKKKLEASLTEKPLPGTLLQFIPRAGEGTLRRGGPPVHFVARPRFVLGRQRSKADFVTWFLPATPANQQKTDTISRVNTTLYTKGNQVWVRDGEILPDGSNKPSAGTVIDSQPLGSNPIQLTFTKERHFRIGQAGYELKALHLSAAAPEGPKGGGDNAPDSTASAQATIRLSTGPFGCLRFQPVSCPDVELNAIWLFSEASVGADASCAATIPDAGLPSVALRVHHWENGFWLVVPGEGPSKVKLDGQPLTGGDVRALQAAHQLDLGSVAYDLKVAG